MNADRRLLVLATLTLATLAVYYSNTFNLEDRLQSEDRIHQIRHTLRIDMNADNRLLVLATRMRAIQDRMDEMDVEWKALAKELDDIRLKQIPDLMSEEGIRTVTFDGIGRVQLTADLYVSIIGNKEETYDWMKDNGYDGVIVEYVHPSTLKALVKEGLKAGREFPEDKFKISPFTRASIVKR
jgi:hypothetical protein